MNRREFLTRAATIPAAVAGVAMMPDEPVMMEYIPPVEFSEAFLNHLQEHKRLLFHERNAVSDVTRQLAADGWVWDGYYQYPNGPFVPFSSEDVR